MLPSGQSTRNSSAKGALPSKASLYSLLHKQLILWMDTINPVLKCPFEGSRSTIRASNCVVQMTLSNWIPHSNVPILPACWASARRCFPALPAEPVLDRLLQSHARGYHQPL